MELQTAVNLEILESRCVALHLRHSFIPSSVCCQLPLASQKCFSRGACSLSHVTDFLIGPFGVSATFSTALCYPVLFWCLYGCIPQGSILESERFICLILLTNLDFLVISTCFATAAYSLWSREPQAETLL